MILFKTPRFFRWIFPNKTWGFSRLDKSIYLTFDDGPDPVVTPWVLDLLAEKGIKATFFCVGSNVLRNPEIYQRILNDGHAVGNHSMKHERGTKNNLKEYVYSVEKAAELIDSNLFRPPYGRLTIPQTNVLKKKFKIIMWSWLSYDFDAKIPVSVILQKAKSQIKAGDILVLHDNPKCFNRVKIMLPKIISLIEKKELGFKIIK